MREQVVRGEIVDTDGKPVGKCSVRLGGSKFSADKRETRSDASGMFTLRGVSDGKWRITFESTKHKPQTMMIEVPLAESMRVILAPGRIVRGRVVDVEGKPRAGASVWIERWQAAGEKIPLNILDFETRTNAEGRFIWRGAPDECVQIGMGNCGDGFRSLYGYPLIARDEEYVIVSKPALRVLGTAVDADTRKLVSLVKVIPGIHWGENDEVSWKPQETMTYQNGSINWQNERMGFSYKLRIEAAGYEPLLTRVYPSNQDEFNETFLLKPKT